MARVHRRDPATVPCDENVSTETPRTQEAFDESRAIFEGLSEVRRPIASNGRCASNGQYLSRCRIKHGVPQTANTASVLVSGRKCPVIGNVTMDMTMIDVTDVGDAAVGSEVTLIGRQGGEEIGAAGLAEQAGTIAYEVVTLISSRVPRVYV